jgi:hypothetical protein
VPPGHWQGVDPGPQFSEAGVQTPVLSRVCPPVDSVRPHVGSIMGRFSEQFLDSIRRKWHGEASIKRVETSAGNCSHFQVLTESRAWNIFTNQFVCSANVNLMC